MSSLPHLVGMIHLIPIPGSPGFGGSMDEVVETAVSDARVLADSGFPALMVENFGDAPFFADTVPPETIAAISTAVRAVRAAADLAIGVNVLRNDALAAIGITAATGASFIRVNVLTGLMYTDQGPIVGRAAEVIRKRDQVAPGVEIWADVMVKHAAPPPGMTLAQAAADTVERGGADAIIVSGSSTGSAPDLSQAKEARTWTPPGTRLVIGSGVKVDNLHALMETADSVIVGSSIKVDGNASNRVDPDRAAHFVKVAAEVGLV